MGEAEEANSISGQNDHVSLQSTLRLNAGDKIWVQIASMGAGTVLFDLYDVPFTHFSGWLLEEEFSLP
jgi:hypothetical protein